MIFTDSTLNGENQLQEVKYIDVYYPYWIKDQYGNKIKNPKFDNFSGLILDLKEGKPQAINHFYKVVHPQIRSNIAITYVPSHDPEKIDSGIKKLAKKLAAESRVDATDCLVRHTKIAKLAEGGDRDKSIHHNSISIFNPHLLKNKHVLIIDDVTTTNHSLLACQEILCNYDVKSVQCLALGQTEGY